MGGGGTTTFNPKDFSEKLAEAKEKARQGFETELSEILRELLSSYVHRNHEEVNEKLKNIREILGTELEEDFANLFGGSVAKHTFVDGISDIDSLLIINDTSLEDLSPEKALKKITDILAPQIKGAKVTCGKMAVTINYSNGLELQLLPAVKNKDGKFHIPDPSNNSWSKVNPIGFNKKLTKINQQCENKLIHVIKLAKAINDGFPETYKLTGYHIESLAIDIFKNYSGPKTTYDMLPKFFEKAKTSVLSPIKDSSGQSVHVDEYLDNDKRKYISHLLDRVEKRMNNANLSQSKQAWLELFGE